MTSTRPAAWAGVEHCILVELETTGNVQGNPPNVTVVPVKKFVPKILQTEISFYFIFIIFLLVIISQSIL